MKVSGGSINHSNAEQKRIKSIQFGLLSPEAIEKMSVCEITNKISFDEKGVPNPNGINDLRMGSTDKVLRCQTCHCKNNDDCPGHFGHIKLAKPVFHIGFISEVLRILKCICYHCNKLLIDDYDKYVELFKIKNPKERQLKVYNLCKNKEKCKERKRKVQEGEEYDTNADPYYKKGCEHFQPKFKRENLKITMDDSKNNEEEQPDQNENEDDDQENLSEITPEKVLSIFTNISPNDCILLGFDPKYSHPAWMIIQTLAVCPPQVRPSVSVDSSLRSQDD
jgi:DNA-directed RNA polymerase II subunit RPB1